MKISDTGEFGLIELLTKGLVYDPATVIRGVGDDTAVLRTDGGKWLLFTTDMLVEEVHFAPAYSSWRQVGAKALAVNISDIAAMGGCPAHALISIGIPRRLAVEDVVELYDGLKEMARVYRVNLVGGDTVAHPERLVINVALLGEVEAGKAVLRSGARPGDWIFVTGTLGASAAGLYLYQHPGTVCPSDAADYCRQAHVNPLPRVDEGRLLAECGVTAMDDISDGLAAELHQICQASGAGCLVRADAVPVAPEVREAASRAGKDPLEWALFGGEDFELVFTVAPGKFPELNRAMAKAGFCIYKVGEITAAGAGLLLALPDGGTAPLPDSGYDHFFRL
ncbi:MAG: thiamine-phosphate kinase [Peptococcaceae bacterium]|nr:MAG: thiamine-phosphate kinase [Peptococcaceae bacterium]